MRLKGLPASLWIRAVLGDQIQRLDCAKPNEKQAASILLQPRSAVPWNLRRCNLLPRRGVSHLSMIRLPLSALILPLSLHAAAGDWPQFRGPTGQGHASATGLPVEWGANQNVVWKTPIPGLGWSSPVVADDRIYLTSAVSKGTEALDANRDLCVLALDAATGQILWQKAIIQQLATEAPKIHQKNSHASPTPIFENGRLYVHFGHMGTACLDAESSDVIWLNRTHSYPPVHGNGGGPVLVDGVLVFNTDGGSDPAVVALDQETGQQRWKTERVSEAKNKFSFSTPLVIEVNGARQIITPGSGVVQALEPATGREIWRVDYDQGYSVVPRPVFAGGLLYVCTGYNKPALLAIRVDANSQGDVTDTHVLWRHDKFIPHNPSVLVAGPELYCLADNGVLSCLDAKSGEVHYQERCTGPASASILHADDRLYLLDERGLGVVVQTGPRFQVLAKNDLDERCLASCAVVGSDLLLRSAEHLYRLGLGAAASR